MNRRVPHTCVSAKLANQLAHRMYHGADCCADHAPSEHTQPWIYRNKLRRSKSRVHTVACPFPRATDSVIQWRERQRLNTTEDCWAPNTVCCISVCVCVCASSNVSVCRIGKLAKSRLLWICEAPWERSGLWSSELFSWTFQPNPSAARFELERHFAISALSHRPAIRPFDIVSVMCLTQFWTEIELRDPHARGRFGCKCF